MMPESRRSARSGSRSRRARDHPNGGRSTVWLVPGDAIPPERDDVYGAFGIEVGHARRHPYGFESECWVIDDRWFVKVWREDPPANLELLKHLDLPVPVPLRTRDGRLTAQTGGRSFAVFPLISGRPATSDDAAELGSVMRRVHDHQTEVPGLNRGDLDSAGIEFLRRNLAHPWISDRRGEVMEMVDRLEAVIQRVHHVEVDRVLCHGDLIGDNVLIGDNGHVVAIVDWDGAALAPREYDLWIATEGPRPGTFLNAYGPVDLDPDHLEYALLGRAVGDLAARVEEQRDRPGIDTWGFDRWRRLDENLGAMLG